MTSPDGRSPVHGDAAPGRDEPVEGRGASSVDEHPDSRGGRGEDPAEGPSSIPDPYTT